MIITLVIYSRDKAIRNNYTWIVWHFVLSMLLAFIILIANQSVDIKTFSDGLCTTIGKHLTIRSNNHSIHTMIAATTIAYSRNIVFVLEF